MLIYFYSLSEFLILNIYNVSIHNYLFMKSVNLNIICMFEIFRLVFKICAFLINYLFNSNSKINLIKVFGLMNLNQKE